MLDDSSKSESANDGQAAINRKTGLEQYENDEMVYAEILGYFAKNNKSALIKLKDEIDAGNIKLAYRTAHSLRGAAGTIGAERLVSSVLIVEKILASMCNAESDASEEKGLNGQLMLLEKEFDAVFGELEITVGEKDEACNCSETPVMNREKTLELIEKLNPFLETGDTKCLEYLDEISEVIRPAAEGFSLFISQMELYDFMKAYETMNRIKRFMIP